MKMRRTKKLIREGEDAKKLEAVRLALRAGDIAAAARHGRVYELHPVSA